MTNEDIKRGTIGGQNFAKDQVGYWLPRLRCRTNQNLQVRIKRGGTEAWFNLGTQNKNRAAQLAREIWLHLCAHGWDETVRAYKSPAANAKDPTVGDFLSAIEKVFPGDKAGTLKIYKGRLRCIYGEVFGIQASAKYKSHHAHSKEWRARVDALKLSRLTPAKVESWRERRVALAGTDQRKKRSAKVTADNIIRNARALFRPKLRGRMGGFEFPEVLPFDGVELSRIRNRYQSKIDIKQLLRSVKEELRDHEPEQYKAFLLAIFAGLRRKEIDQLKWSSVHQDRIFVEVHETFMGKTESSISEVSVDPEVISELRSGEEGEFVLCGNKEPLRNPHLGYYRCNSVFSNLCTWLREHGVTDRSPIHTLRKEFGSIVNGTHGIHAAMHALRHSTIQVTEAFYADNRKDLAVRIAQFEQTAG